MRRRRNGQRYSLCLGQVIVAACGAASARVPENWAANSERPGVHFLPDLSAAAAIALGGPVRRLRRPGDIALASLHWGPNWGYDVRHAFREFADTLIDAAGFDLVFGHSSHHAKGIEFRNGRLIVYGAGDFLNDYEGIGGYAFCGDLASLYLPVLSRSIGRLAALDIAPFQIRQFRLNRTSESDARWLARTLDHESPSLGARVALK
jgi:poly-gamma-glutamate synthesis protein (capsule biosynthesis protein)